MFQIHMRHNLMTTTNELAQVTVTAELFDAKVSEVLAILRTTNWHFDEEGDHQSFPQKAEILASLFGIHLQTTIHYYLTRQLRCEMSEDISEEDLYFLATMIAQLLNAGLFRQLPSARR
ncbi:hypothetical protein KA012_02620 [Candidatus Woesebacteria bacterium]|nr:hypothetical protein [Candidatus Woesebacteria bacterium]